MKKLLVLFLLCGLSPVKSIALPTLNTVTSDFTVPSCDYYLQVDATSSNITITADDATFCDGARIFIIQRIDNVPSHTVTVIPSSGTGQTLGGRSSFHLATQNEAWRFYSDTVNWIQEYHYANSSPQSFTMTIGSTGTAPTLGTVTTNQAVWWRVGKYMNIQFTLNETGGSNGSGTYLFPLPFGTMDTGLATVTPSLTNFFGRGTVLGNGVISNAGLLGNSFNAVVQSSDSTHLFLGVPQQGLLGSLLGGLGSTSQAISFTAAVPMSGWEP